MAQTKSGNAEKEQAVDIDAWLTLDRGEWDYVTISDQANDELSAAGTRMEMFFCGHWRVGVTNIPADARVGGYRYMVTIEAGIPVDANGEEDGPAAILDTILARDTPSLLQLFALLRSADIEYKPPERKA